MRKNIYCSFIFCFFVFFCHAQKDRDYILTLQKDTLFGKILMEEGLHPITFIHNKKVKLTYHPSTLQSFGVFREKEYKRYKSLTSKGGKNIFVEILVEGKINLYKYSEKHHLRNSILTKYVYLMGASDDALSTISSSSYQRILNALLKKYPSLLSQLADCSYDEVPKLIEQYNRLVFR